MEQRQEGRLLGVGGKVSALLLLAGYSFLQL